MELTWYGRTCIRMKGRDAVVVADPYASVVGPTGRGITANVITFSHPDPAPIARAKGRKARDGKTVIPTSLDSAFDLVGPGEYEISQVLLTGVRTYRDDEQGTTQGQQTAFIVELDGMHTIHLGDIGHLLTEEKLSDIGSVDIACVPIGGTLSATKAAELVAQLDPRIVIAMPVPDDEQEAEVAVGRFFHEMGETPATQPKLSISLSGLPAETTTVLLESRSKSA